MACSGTALLFYLSLWDIVVYDFSSPCVENSIMFPEEIYVLYLPFLTTFHLEETRRCM